MLASALCTILSMETKSPRSALSPCSGILMSLTSASADLVLLLRALSLTPGSLTVSSLRLTSLSIDYIDPAAGVNLYYYNGDYYLAGHYYMGTILSFRCSDSATLPKYADVERSAVSTHIIWLDSVYACPKGMFQNLVISIPYFYFLLKYKFPLLCSRSRVLSQQPRSDLQWPRHLHERQQYRG